MEIQQLCAALRERVACDLQGTTEPAVREELLVAALYQLSRSILPGLAAPGKSREYRDQQAAVGELISFISIPLIRCGAPGRCVAVLSELAESCRDPLLKKKCSVYAQELRSRKDTPAKGVGPALGRPQVAGSLCIAAALGIYLVVQAPATPTRRPALAATPEAVETLPAVAYHALPAAPEAPSGAEPPRGEDGAVTERQPRFSSPDAEAPALPGEVVTRVRFAGNQVLIPVTLKNGSDVLRVELVLDTGATRTSIHEGVATKLGIELRNTKASLSEVADGRTINSRTARIDSLAVGPYAMNSAEVELIPYKGDGSHAGLLGMDFLAKHRYQIDLEREVIRWF